MMELELVVVVVLGVDVAMAERAAIGEQLSLFWTGVFIRLRRLIFLMNFAIAGRLPIRDAIHFHTFLSAASCSISE